MTLVCVSKAVNHDWSSVHFSSHYFLSPHGNYLHVDFLFEVRQKDKYFYVMQISNNLRFVDLVS